MTELSRIDEIRAMVALAEREGTPGVDGWLEDVKCLLSEIDNGSSRAGTAKGDPAMSEPGGREAKDALVNYPGMGSLWLEDASVVDGYVVGKVWEPMDGSGGEYLTMNFPLNCVRKWSP